RSSRRSSYGSSVSRSWCGTRRGGASERRFRYRRTESRKRGNDDAADENTHPCFGPHARAAVHPRNGRGRLCARRARAGRLLEDEDRRLAGREVFCDRRSDRSEEHTSELQSRGHLVCRLLLEKKKTAELASAAALSDRLVGA